MNSCPSIERLQQLLAEQLSDTERHAIESHIEGCAACQQLLAEFTRTADSEHAWTKSAARPWSHYHSADTLFRRLKHEPAPAADSGSAGAETLQTLGKPPAVAAEHWPQVPGYEIQGVLGWGGMGVVYLARHRTLNRPVALKMIQTGYQGQPAMLARFRTEAEAIARLQHPHVVQIFEVGECNGLPYLALEYVEGGSLHQRLDGAPLPAGQAVSLIETLARAVDAAHQRGLIHRDLKPSNVLLTAEGTPKVSDFGLAKWLDSGSGQTATGEVLGTPSYMAPEQAQSKKATVSPATDVYALGAILYELLTGRPPFRAATPLDTLIQVLYEEPVPPRRLQRATPRDLETICLKCLQKEPRKRYASAESLADDLNRFVQNRPIHAHPVSPWERAWKWTKRQPAWAALIAVSILATVALVLGGFWYGARLQAAVEESRKNAQTAQEQRQEALANARKARAAVDHLLTEVAEKHLVQIPQTEMMRLALLNKALEFYQDFAKEPEAGWEVRLEKARALHRLGDIYRYLERYAESETAYQQAIAAFLQQAEEKPDDVDVVLYLAKSYNDLGVLYRVMRRPVQAEKAHRSALNIRLQLDSEHPLEIQHRANLAESYHNLALLHHSANRYEEAEKYYRDDLKIKEELVRASAEDPDRRYDLADVYASVSHLCYCQDRPQERESVSSGKRFRFWKVCSTSTLPRPNINTR